MSLEQQAPYCEIALFVDRKLKADVSLWLDYRPSQQAWEFNKRAQKRLDDKQQEAYIKMFVEDL